MDRLSYSRRWFPLFSPDGEGGGGEPQGPSGASGPSGPTGPMGTSGPAEPVITPELQKIIDTRAAAARKEGEAKAQEKIDAAKRAADDKAEQDRKVAAGEFDAVRVDLEAKHKTAQAERDDYKDRYEKAIDAIKPGVEANWKDLPAEVTAIYDGAEGDVLAMAAFIDKAKTLTAALKANGPGNPLFPKTPKPDLPVKKDEIKSLVNTRNI